IVHEDQQQVPSVWRETKRRAVPPGELADSGLVMLAVGLSWTSCDIPDPHTSIPTPFHPRAASRDECASIQRERQCSCARLMAPKLDDLAARSDVQQSYSLPPGTRKHL